MTEHSHVLIVAWQGLTQREGIVQYMGYSAKYVSSMTISHLFEKDKIAHNESIS